MLAFVAGGDILAEEVFAQSVRGALHVVARVAGSARARRRHRARLHAQEARHVPGT